MDFKNCISYCDNGRTNAVLYTIDAQKISELKNLGWIYEVTTNGYKMKSPDVWVVDLVDPWKVNYFKNPVVNLAYYDYLMYNKEKMNLRNLIKNVIDLASNYYEHFEFDISEGIALETEIRILGNDNRVFDIKRDLFNYFLKNSKFDKYLNATNKFLCYKEKLKLFTHKPLYKQPAQVKNFFINLEKIFNRIGYSNTYNPLILSNIINQLPKYDIMLFLPRGCFKFLSSFTCSTNIDSIMFYEMHADKNNIRKSECFVKNLENKYVLIVDSCYSGQTLTMISSMVISKKGKPIKLAVFPKSKEAIKVSDYVLIGNKIIKSMDINTDDKNWSRNIFREIF